MMSRTRILRFSLASVLVMWTVPVAQAQEHPPPHHEEPLLPETPGSLEEMLDIAMEHNPEIRLKEAQLHQAEAELHATRLRVAREVTEIHARRAKVRHLLGLIESREMTGELEAKMAELDAQLAELEAHARFVLGMGWPPHEGHPHEGPETPGIKFEPRPRPEMPSHFQELLDKPVSLDLVHVPLREALEVISGQAGVEVACNRDLPEVEVSIDVQDAPLHEVLTVLADQFDFLCFVMRDYGVFATTREHASGLPAPTVPPDIPLFAPPHERAEPPLE